MIGWLALVLQASAVAFTVAFAVSTLLVGVAKALFRLPTSAARRADSAFVLGVLPFVVGASLLGAMMLPSVLHATGMRLDHCGLHSHHAHLCALHADAANPVLLAAGLALVLFTAVRGLGLARRQLRAMAAVAQLEGLGASERGVFPVTRVPGSPWVCLATGGWRPRVVMSATLEDVLGADGLSAVLAHEYAHLRRRDPALRVALAWATLFAVPGAATALQVAFREAAEEASDAEAASSHGALPLAEALVAMVRLSRRPSPIVCLGIGDSSLERRVRLLLDGSVVAHDSWSLPTSMGLLFGGFAVSFVGAEALHHSVETLLHTWL